MEKSCLYKKLSKYFSKKKLKSTKQRDIIIDAFFKMKGKHVKIEELWNEVRQENQNIGYATVYRTLMILVDAKVASQRQFNDGQSRFEIISTTHHDHLICTDCNKIIEFENSTVEKIQKQIAEKFEFMLTGHKMELYGLCKQCSHKAKNNID